MSIQDALQMAGVISCVVAVLLTLLTVHSFVSQDIPSVLDDLSGRKRSRELRLMVTQGVREVLPVVTPTPPDVSRVSVGEHDVATEVATSVRDGREETGGEAAYELAFDVVLCGSTDGMLDGRSCDA